MNSLTGIKKKYRNISAPAKASFFFALCNIMQRGVSLISTPIFTRLLTAEQYGLYSVYNSWYTILLIFGTLNLSYDVYIKGLVQYENDPERLTSSMLGLSVTFTVALFGIYLLNIDFWNKFLELPALLVFAMFAELLFVPAFGFWSALQRFQYKYKALIGVTLIMAFSGPVCGVIAVLGTEHKAEARILSYVLVQACMGAFFFALLFYRGKHFFIKKYWKYALRFNLPLIPHYLSMTILNQLDRIMISKMVGTGESAIYSVAYTVSTIMLLITQAVNHSFTPYTYQALRDGEYEGINQKAKALLAVIGAGCIVVMLFGPEIIALFASKEYYDAIWVIPPVAASVYFRFLYPLFGNVEFFFEETKYTMAASCGGAIINILLNYFFIRSCGYYAAGYTTLLCYILFAVAHSLAYKKVCKKNQIEKEIYSMKYMLALSILLLGAMAAVLPVYKYRLLRYLSGAALAVSAIACREKIKKTVSALV